MGLLDAAQASDIAKVHAKLAAGKEVDSVDEVRPVLLLSLLVFVLLLFRSINARPSQAVVHLHSAAS